MWLSNYIALIGWVVVCIVLFLTMPPQKAIIISVLGAFLFLPMSKIPITHIPPGLDKTTAVAFGIFFGELFSSSKAKYPLKRSSYDLPNTLFCFAVPLASSLSNNLGLYDGISRVVSSVLTWGIFFWAGRRYFGTPSSIRALTKAIMIGGLIYVPFVVFELIKSPILSINVYGFFAHSWSQHIRYGGWRPIVFMPHGLVLAIWMSVSTTIFFWLWQSKGVTKVGKLPVALVWCVLACMTVLCKSANGVVFMILGIITYYIYKNNNSSKVLQWLLLIIPCYLFFRLSGLVSPYRLQDYMSKIFDANRMDSFMVRIWQEYSISRQGLLRPLFGWGWMARAFPIDPITHETINTVVDSSWIITFGCNGFFGLISEYLSIGLGPLLVLTASGRHKNNDSNEKEPYAPSAIVLSIIVAFFLLDSLMNSSIPPIVILCSGALISYHEKKD